MRGIRDTGCDNDVRFPRLKNRQIFGPDKAFGVRFEKLIVVSAAMQYDEFGKKWSGLR
jgi:hypothetical protein